MFAGIKLLWLVAGKVLADITIQFDDFNPFDEPDDSGPPVTSRFLRQLRLNDINSSVPRTSGISHIPDDEADDDGSDDDVDNSDADFPRLRVDNEADVKVSEHRTQVDDAGADVNLPEERAQVDDASADGIRGAEGPAQPDGTDSSRAAEVPEPSPPSNDMADGDSDAEDTEQRAQVDDAGVDNVGGQATTLPVATPGGTDSTGEDKEGGAEMTSASSRPTSESDINSLDKGSDGKDESGSNRRRVIDNALDSIIAEGSKIAKGPPRGSIGGSLGASTAAQTLGPVLKPGTTGQAVVSATDANSNAQPTVSRDYNNVSADRDADMKDVESTKGANVQPVDIDTEMQEVDPLDTDTDMYYAVPIDNDAEMREVESVDAMTGRNAGGLTAGDAAKKSAASRTGGETMAKADEKNGASGSRSEKTATPMPVIPASIGIPTPAPTDTKTIHDVG
ncbi:hypothetical protein H4S03_003470, partial [Coemansia sp. S3946]